MTGGLPRGTVAIHAYNAGWIQDFASEKQVLEQVFGAAAQAIEHVGSTAVPGLSAKPIIDIEVGLKDFSEWKKLIRSLEKAGYAFMPERVRNDQVFMPKGPEAHRTHYLHITQFGSSEWRAVLLFRDKLRASSILRDEYEKLKQHLAAQFPDDRKAYSAGKKAFIERIIHHD